MASRALPDLIARIKIDSSGVDQGLSNLVGSFGRANLALAGVAAGIGLLVVGGKSMIDISEKWDAAQRGLTQAVEAHNAITASTVDNTAAVTKATENLEKAQRSLDEFLVGHKGHKMTQLDLMHQADATQRVTDATNALKDAQASGQTVTAATAINLEAYRRQIDDFIMANRRYISDQSEVVDGYAKLARSGLSQTEVQRAMNDAVDLAAIKHISLSDAVTLLDNAEHGRMRGLIDLGITTAKYTDAQGNLILANHSVAQSMDELDAKLKGGRRSLSELQQSQNELGNNWQSLAQKDGPALVHVLDLLVQFATLSGEAFDHIGWILHNRTLPAMEHFAKDAQHALQPLGDLLGRIGEYISGAPITYPSSPSQFPGGIHRATGGPVIPGGIYTVGENGPETLMMGAGGGGMVIPGGTTHYNLTLNGSSAVNDPEGVRRMLQRMSLMGAAS